MKRVIIVGSPRSNGRSAHLAEMLFEANIDERPEDELFLVPISEIDVGPCIGCNACRKKSEVTFKDDDGNEVTELFHRCIFDDDMQTVYDLLDDVDALTVVTPIYFSGLPGPMKCLIDRLQPYFWEYCENGPRLPKRPLELHVVGEGGDPHGFAPLISEVKGPTALAGFGLERILSWVGKIDAKGEIIAEADDVPVPPRGSYAAFVSGEDAGSGGSELIGPAGTVGSAGAAGFDSAAGAVGSAVSAGPVAGVAAYAPEEAKVAVRQEAAASEKEESSESSKSVEGSNDAEGFEGAVNPKGTERHKGVKSGTDAKGANGQQKSRPKLNLRQGQKPAQSKTNKQNQAQKPRNTKQQPGGQLGAKQQGNKRGKGGKRG